METYWQFIIWTVGAAGVLALVIGAWLVVEKILNPTSARVKDPDACACITGVCGDTMEVSLKIRDGKVSSAGYWASGCGPSSACGAMATRLAIGKDLDEIPEAVDYLAIEKAVGGLPEDKMHCAKLAAEALQEAVHRYYLEHREDSSEDQGKDKEGMP